MRKVVILDTSMLCVWLQVSGYETCGTTKDNWNFDRVDQKIKEEINSQSTLVLPLATIIETGNHISHTSGNLRYKTAQKLCDILICALNNEEPWAAFSAQAELWNDENVLELANDWPELAQQSISIADATIIKVAQYYYEFGCNVEILTGDGGLKSYEPIPPEHPPIVPRRRK
ncbi:MAG: hypothetical protein IPM47_02270 [Sphingobacteriales bacterium]|nr:MAG: hypothetical protein IPM47_02270 [Sphingobacteriales bacterium]